MKKRIFTLLLCVGIIGFVFFNLDAITNYIAAYFYSTPKIVKTDKNRFSKEIDYEFVQISHDFIPYNYQELLNIFYTVLDAGYETFTFYCPTEYEDCIDDVIKISDKNNKELLTTVGNYISPYNNFTSIEVFYDRAGEVTINVSRLYSEDDILNITNKIDSIWKSIIKEDMDTYDAIIAFHDYIINNTRYDKEYEKELQEIKSGLREKTTHASNKANGPLFEGYAICSGYTDVMAMFLDKLGVKNFKVASDTHVWNVINLDGTWKHIDLTWDDPLSEEDSSINYLEHKFFYIDTESLEQHDIKDHTFNKSYYLELKK